MSAVETILTQIATKVNSIGALNTGVSATVDFFPDLDFSKISTQICKVVPMGYSTENQTRCTSKREVSANIVICEKIDTANLQLRVAAVESIINGIERAMLTNAVIVKVSVSPLYDIDLLKERRLFLANLLVTCIEV